MNLFSKILNIYLLFNILKKFGGVTAPSACTWFHPCMEKAQCEFQKDCHNNKESGVSYDESWLDELLLSDFHQRHSLAAFLTNFHIYQGVVPFKYYKKT